MEETGVNPISARHTALPPVLTPTFHPLLCLLLSTDLTNLMNS